MGGLGHAVLIHRLGDSKFQRQTLVERKIPLPLLFENAQRKVLICLPDLINGACRPFRYLVADHLGIVRRCFVKSIHFGVQLSFIGFLGERQRNLVHAFEADFSYCKFSFRRVIFVYRAGSIKF